MEIYQTLARIAFPYIITTNYDKLIELTRKSELRPKNIIRDDDSALDVSFGRETILIKMHGDIEKNTSMIVTESELNTYRKSHKNLNDLILSILKQGPVLFLGFSKSSASFIDIAVEYITSLPTTSKPHPWFIIDNKTMPQIINKLNKENNILIEENLDNFINNLYKIYTSENYTTIPPEINTHEVLQRLTIQIKEIQELLSETVKINNKLNIPNQQRIAEINLINELESLQIEVDIQKETLRSINEYEEDRKEITEELINSTLEETKEMFEPLSSKIDRDIKKSLENITTLCPQEIGRIEDDKVFHSKCKKYLKLFMPEYGNKALEKEDFQKQEDKYAEILFLWKNNHQAEFYAHYFIKKYEQINNVWPPRGTKFPDESEIKQYIKVENFSEIYKDSTVIQSVNIGLQRLKGALEDSLQHYITKGFNPNEDFDVNEIAKNNTMIDYLKQKMKELNQESLKYNSEIKNKKLQFSKN